MGYMGLGALAYVGLLVALAASMIFAARGAARLLGVQGFRWFNLASAPSSWWRLLLVWTAAALAPWGVSATLFWLQFWIDGDAVMTTRVEVLEGPARSAGVRDGDRILRVAGRRSTSWDELRQEVQRQRDTFELEVERGSEKLTIPITPKAGRIGVSPISDRVPLGPLQAALRALPLPAHVVHDSVLNLTRTLSGSEKTELKGPVGIVREGAKAQRASALLAFLAVLAAYFGSFFASIALFDAASSALFVATHPSASTWTPRAQRLARLQQTIVLSLSGYVLALVSIGVATAGVSSAAWGILLALVLITSVFPLLWFGGAEVWRPASRWLVVLGGFVVPCIGAIALFNLLLTLRRELKAEGFRAAGLRTSPTTAASA